MKKIFFLFTISLIFAVSCKKVDAKGKSDVALQDFSSSQVSSDSKKSLSFSSIDLNGNPVTNDIFSQAQVTVLNIWGTFCPPCIAEMPELAAWSKEMDENVQIIGLVCDVNSAKDTTGIETANTILYNANADFLNVIANETFSPFLRGIQFVPTTFLIDKNGTIIGDMIVGADVQKYKNAVESYLGN